MAHDLKARVLRELKLSPDAAEVISLSPLAEGMNMGIWIGFKHVNYLTEHAISIFLRQRMGGIRGLYWGEGLSFHFVASKMRYVAALTFDETVHVCIVTSVRDRGARITFEIHAMSERFGSLCRLAQGSTEAVFRGRDGRQVDPLPERLLSALEGQARRARPAAGTTRTAERRA